MTTTEPTIRTVRVIRHRYTIEDDGNGGSMAVETSTDISEEACDGSSGHYFDAGMARDVWWRESAAREAVGIIRREFLGTLADAEWFGHPDPSTVDYATGEEEETTAHLIGPWTDVEWRAIARMVAWLETRDAERTAAYFARRNDYVGHAPAGWGITS